MKTFIFLFTFLFCYTYLPAQSVTNKNNAAKGIINLYKKAEKQWYSGQKDKAEKLFKKTIQKDPNFIDGYLRLGGMAYEEGHFPDAIEYFKHALSLDRNYDTKLYQALSLSHEKLKNYQTAADYISEYLTSSADLKIEEKERMIRKKEHLEFRSYAINNPVPFHPEKLPEMINTSEFSEYLPSLTADEQLIFFTRVSENQEDIYYSIKDENGNWQESKMMPNINTFENEGAHTISADGRTIAFTFCSDGRGGKPRGCNIYISFLKNNSWTSPAYFEAINSSSWDSQPNFSADGRTIIFTSRRPGGNGGSDLYWSKKDADGIWGKPVNLGPVINTSGNEESPFLHADGKTLFFNSDNHPGMGSFDLFYSRLLPDHSWTKPENLGYPINTEEHEGALIISLDGQTAYYSRGDGGVNFDQKQTDIYTFELPEKLRPAPVGFVQITVIDKETLLPLPSEINLLASADNIGTEDSFKTDDEGVLLIPLPLGKNYSLVIEKTGYLLYSDRFELLELDQKETAFKMAVYLTRITEDTIADESPIVLRNVLFETNSYKIKEESFFELDKLFQLLLENPKIKIEIRGHTDNIGSEEDNLLLSENRARSVYEYLLLKGISEDRLSYKGFGESKPLDSNDDENGRRNNRRTEFVIIN